MANESLTQTLRPRFSAWAWMLVLGVSASWTIGCERAHLTDGLPNTLDCSACHGSPGNPAPPKGLNGSTSTSDVGVGAHDAHMLGSSIAAPVACVECHPQPTDLLTHPDINLTPAEMVFGPIATSGGAEPSWDRSAATCTDTYCHGNTLPGAERRAAPVWTRVDGTQRRCSSCHGSPPPDPHPSEGACESCHADVAGPGSSIKDPSRHVNGVVDLAGATSSRESSNRTRLARNRALQDRRSANVRVAKW